MMVWIHDVRSDSDVLINSEYVSSVEQDQFDNDSFHIRMVNHDLYTVNGKENTIWLTMRE